MLRKCAAALRARGLVPDAAACASRVQSSWLQTSSSSQHQSDAPAEGQETISVTYIDKEGKEHTVAAPIGKTLLEVAHENEIDLEGACEGSLACSTCHLIFEDEDFYKKIAEPTEDEQDMLDLAFGLTDTSRLGCQVLACKELDGVRVRIPSASRNFYVDGHKPKPH
ncbi:2Fe-2S ferredoxin [Tetrabaena socialis]|uniref:2Fe-2S ferredoxin n=1 Tax=Tetrabaena socialis TaxID=47790 RepID=A0A2J8AK24_9CHLO|nr:2Fe-2S ferredoxin [Tetrabaena socialis]|eukprot:PNH12869.1 2Fe-2S ferredoxin [Tetrabaena socialis]